MAYEKEIHEFIESHRDEMISDLFDLMRIDSERGEAKEGKPYGDGPAEALDKGCEILTKYGFDVKNYDNHVITGDFGPEKRQLDILAHLDVVPAGDGWTETKPFEPVEKDGFIYGRGCSDDKGPAVSAIYALRAIKELNIPLKKGVRLILGSDEECGSDDVAYYYTKEEAAPMSFSPDASWPLINIEKGGLQAEFTADYKTTEKTPCVVSVTGGVKINVAPGKADATVKGLDFTDEVQNIIGETAVETGVTFQVRFNEDLMLIHAIGETVHASTPENGKNAITALVYLLSKLPLSKATVNKHIKNLADLFPYGKVHGEGLGVDMKDKTSGWTTVSLDLIDVNETHFSASFDMRASIKADEENTGDVIEAAIKDHGFKYKRPAMYAPHMVDSRTKLVKTLLSCYEKGFGVEGAKPIAIGGGTYVHHVEGGVAFGCEEEGFDNRMHGGNERMKESMLLKSAEVFADAIIELCN